MMIMMDVEMVLMMHRLNGMIIMIMILPQMIVMMMMIMVEPLIM